LWHPFHQIICGLRLQIDIITSHYPPSGILDNDYGSEEIREFVLERSPSYHIFGHNHAGYGKIKVKAIQFINASLYELLEGMEAMISMAILALTTTFLLIFLIILLIKLILIFLLKAILNGLRWISGNLFIDSSHKIIYSFYLIILIGLYIHDTAKTNKRT